MKRVLRFFIAVLGMGIGCGLVALVMYNITFPGYSYVMRYTTTTPVLTAIYVISGFLFGLIAYIISPKITGFLQRTFKRAENKLTAVPALDILFCVAGTMVGIVFAFLLSLILRTIDMPVLPDVLTVLFYLLFGYLGGYLGVTRRAELMHESAKKSGASDVPQAYRKVLDTSVIIDGRILDLCRSGILEGEIIIPAFVLKELRHIADSGDALKRNRGRRGLDILKEMQEAFGERVRVVDQDYDDVDEVDVKLLRLAGDLGGVLVTNDYNLNKVAAVQNLRVLNINDVANAIKPVLLPGEELMLQIIREGKEQGQGVGYLGDGTMVIVDNGKKHIGETPTLVVTSALQTSAGRMVFARIK